MAEHSCMKLWVNGYEVSTSIDDNLCGKFRSESILFKNTDHFESITEAIVKELGSRSVSCMAENILELCRLARSMPTGDVLPFFDYVKNC